MNVEELVRETLREQAAAQPPARAGFADRVLAARRRRRARRLASVAVAAAAVVAVAVGVPLLDSGKDDVRPAGVLDSGGVSAHPDQSPPRDLIAAGRTALAAYYTTKTVPLTADRGALVRTYRLLNPGTGRYEKDSRWSYAAVAPGLRTAAVLERALPASRIGLLDLGTGKVERWIPVRHGVGGLAFSRDGRKLVATTYKENPDQCDRSTEQTSGDTICMPRFGARIRTGFAVLDVASGKGSWSAVSANRAVIGREDFAFSRDGARVFARVVGERDGTEQFYDLAGREAAAPADEKHLRWDVGARLSPDGTLAAWGLVKERRDRSYSAIVDPRTGRHITAVRGAELAAWADNKRLIAWERMPGVKEYRPRLVLVTLGSEHVVPLSGFSEVNKFDSPQTWQPVFAER
ncbi:WD40 repeat domain-containing protein [Streptomyces sp. NPDC007905]|uniref:WD40 repeat domain-containing protein n=1 Tax=Streptomyces sp. NPDC007905 TaxID=3364788 RepID=UPI0036F16995